MLLLISNLNPTYERLLLKLLNYDHFENKVIVKAIIENGEPGKAVKLMAHLLAAQQIWLNRCKGFSTTDIALWPNSNADTFDNIIFENHQDWIDFLTG